MNKLKTLSLMMATVLTLGVSTSAFAAPSAQKTVDEISAATQSKKQVVVSKEKAVDMSTKILKMLDTDMKVEQSKRNLKLSATLKSNENKNEWCIQWKDSKGKCFASVFIDYKTGIVHSCLSLKYKSQGEAVKLSSQDVASLKESAIKFLIDYNGEDAEKNIISSTTSYNKSEKCEAFTVNFKLKDNSNFSVIFDSKTKQIISILM